MDSLIQELLDYLNDTPEEKKREDWKELAKYGRTGPLDYDYFPYLLGNVPKMEIKNNNKIPEYPLEFLFLNGKNLHHERSSIFIG